MRLGLVADKDFDDYDIFKESMLQYNILPKIIFTGNIQTIVEEYSIETGVDYVQYEIDWNDGPQKSYEEIINSGIHEALVFWDGKQKQTKYFIDLCLKTNTNVRIIFWR